MKRVKIHIRGQIDENWAGWFEGLEVQTLDDVMTILHGEVADQSMLYGILAKLRDLGLELISVEQVD